MQYVHSILSDTSEASWRFVRDRQGGSGAPRGRPVFLGLWFYLINILFPEAARPRNAVLPEASAKK